MAQVSMRRSNVFCIKSSFLGKFNNKSDADKFKEISAVASEFEKNLEKAKRNKTV